MQEIWCSTSLGEALKSDTEQNLEQDKETASDNFSTSKNVCWDNACVIPPGICISGNGVQFNSKDVGKGDLFIALSAGKGDGHDYAVDAIMRGASAVMLERINNDIPKEKQIIVPNCLQALSKLAKYKRKNSRAKFIAITGSNGKTSTKEALALALEKCGKVFASRGNFNNHLGVPINLASIPNNIEFAIFELGMSNPGEIANLTKQVEPDIALIVSISAVHIEYFESVNEIAKAKAEIYQGLKSEGIAIYPGDSMYLSEIKESLDKLSVENRYSFGVSENSDGQLCSVLTSVENNESIFEYKIFGKIYKIRTGYLPKKLAENFAACLVVISLLKLDIEKAIAGLIKFKQLQGRGSRQLININDQQITLIADYYNSSPASLKLALESLLEFKNPTNRVLAFIGDMAELGERKREFNMQLAPLVAKLDGVVLIGPGSKFLVDKICKNWQFYAHYDNIDQFVRDFNKFNQNAKFYQGDYLLIKGSRSMHLEKIANYMGVKNAL